MPLKDRKKLYEYIKKWKHKNKEKISLGGKKYRLNNVEKEKIRHKLYRMKNKEQESQYHKNYYLKNKERISENRRKYQYRYYFGLSMEQVLDILNRQDSKCKICERVIHLHGERNPLSGHLDHDHKTGKIRGFLCSRCNLSIGKFEDDYRLLQKAVDYLKPPASGGVSIELLENGDYRGSLT